MKQLVPALFAVGALMALVGAAVFITGWIYAPYIYTIGAGFVALAQINTPVKGTVSYTHLRAHETSDNKSFLIIFLFTWEPA